MRRRQLNRNIPSPFGAGPVLQFLEAKFPLSLAMNTLSMCLALPICYNQLGEWGRHRSYPWNAKIALVLVEINVL